MATAMSATSAHGAAVAYQIDLQGSFVHFEVVHFGTSTLRGRLGRIQGEVDRKSVV